jgi:foldase protein PrsA
MICYITDLEKEHIMKNIKKPIALLLCLILVATFSFAACGKKSSSNTNKLTLGSGGGGDVLATVSGAAIKSERVDAVAAFLLYMYYGEDYSTLEAGDEKDEWRNDILVNFFVDNELIKNYLLDNNIDPLTDEVTAQIASEITDLYSYEENLEASLTAMGVTKDDLQFYFEANKFYDAYSDAILAANPVTDEEISEYYEEYKDEFVSPGSIRASHILMMDPDHGDTTRAAIEAVLEKAEAGEDFAELAKEYGEDGTKDVGGDLGFFGEGAMVPEFEEAAYALDVGELSDIVETEFGYHIILKTDEEPDYQKTLDEARSEIVETIGEERVYEALEEYKEQTKDAVVYKIDVSSATATEEEEEGDELSEEELAALLEEEGAGDDEYVYDDEDDEEYADDEEDAGDDETDDNGESAGEDENS